MLHASSDLYGASKIFLTAALTFRERGHDVVVVLSEEGPLTENFRKEGIEVQIIRLGILRRKYFNIPGIINRLRVLRNAHIQLKKLVRERNIDMVFSQTAAVLIGAVVAKATKKPHVWQVLEITEKPYWFLRGMAYAFNHYANKVIVASEAVRNHWKNHVDEKKLTRIYYGVDSSAYTDTKPTLKKELGLSENHLIVGMIGRVHYWKGQDYFLRIAGEIARHHPDVHFVMIGDVFPGYEYLYDNLSHIIKNEGLEGKVSDLGFRTDIENLLAGMDIFIQPSTLPDPFPTVILEAMAASKPVVATGLGGAKEMIVHGETGYLIPLNKQTEVFNMIKPLLESEAVRNEMGAKARERLDAHFTLDNYKANIGRFIHNLLEST